MEKVAHVQILAKFLCQITCTYNFNKGRGRLEQVTWHSSFADSAIFIGGLLKVECPWGGALASLIPYMSP